MCSQGSTEFPTYAFTSRFFPPWVEKLEKTEEPVILVAAPHDPRGLFLRERALQACNSGGFMRSRVAYVVLSAALGAVGLSACGGNVVVDPAEGTGAGGQGSPTSSSANTTATATSTSTGTGGSGGSGLIELLCPDIAAEAHHCVTVGYDSLALVSPNTGNTCVLTYVQSSIPPEASSIALRADHVYVCTNESMLQIAIVDGSVSEAPIACGAVTSYQGGLLVKPPLSQGPGKELYHYASFEDVIANLPTQILAIDDGNTRMTAQGSTLFTAWHAGSDVAHFSLPSGEPLMPLFLQGFDDWFNGLSATDDNRFIVLSSENRLATFDASSGALLQDAYALGGLLSGLHCIFKP